MPRFSYDALDADGRPAKGELDAADRRAAARRLAAQGLRVSRLAQSGKAAAAVGENGEDHPALHTPRRFGAHPTAIAFIGGFAELHEGGMPVGDAVKLMASRVTEPALRALTRALWRDLAEGMPLSAALAKRPVVFDEATVRLVEAGEATGNLVPVLSRVREAYEKREALRARVLSAIGYPILLTSMAGVVLALFVFVIMPIMERIMGTLGGTFPWHVKALMVGAAFLVKGSPLILLGLGLVFLRLRKARADEAVKRRQDAFALRLPLAGKALVYTEAARLADLLATLLGSGVNAAQALRLAEKPVANAELRARFTEARHRVHDGAAISSALKDTGMFTAEDLDLIAIGENAGALPRAFASVGTRSNKALDAAIARIVRVITTSFLTLVVSLVGFCLVTIITTIISVTQNISINR